MIIGIPVYDKVDLLDVTGPYEIFQWMNQYGQNVEVYTVAEKPGEIASRDGFRFRPHKCFPEIERLDVIWVPGGDPAALKLLMSGPDRTYLDFLIAQSRTARYVTSVCEGALLLAAAGLLDGYTATTHWAFIPCLKAFPAITIAPGYPRFVVDRNRVTGGGISSDLDEALKLVELIGGEALAQSIQQVTQYYPDPPVRSSIPQADTCPFSW
jgi:transcriptional regulator GlxA family with amidase domain